MRYVIWTTAGVQEACQVRSAKRTRSVPAMRTAAKPLIGLDYILYLVL